MKIVGAGMSGLIAANMLRRYRPQIIESQAHIPNNHKALLRFRSNAVGDSCGIKLKEVTVRKSINYKGENFSNATIKMSNEYCYKVTGKYTDRSIWNLDTCKRYIAPEEFISLISSGLDITFGIDFSFCDNSEVTISTIPMLSLMKILNWTDIPEFKTKEIYTVTGLILDPETELYQTIYYPNCDLPIYRMSITGNKVIAEFNSELKDYYRINKFKMPIVEVIEHFLFGDFGIKCTGLHNVLESHQKYGKLIETDPEICKKFISWATNKHNIYSLGRWGTHRQLLMDDVVNDIKVISKLIDNNNYGVLK